MRNPQNVFPFEASVPTSSPSSCEYNWKVEIEILRPETYFFFWVLMTFLFWYLPQASSVYIVELKSVGSCFLTLASWRGFVGVWSRFGKGRLKGDKLSGCELVNFSFATLCKLEGYTAKDNKAHNVINNAMREFFLKWPYLPAGTTHRNWPEDLLLHEVPYRTICNLNFVTINWTKFGSFITRSHLFIMQCSKENFPFWNVFRCVWESL